MIARWLEQLRNWLLKPVVDTLHDTEQRIYVSLDAVRRDAASGTGAALQIVQAKIERELRDNTNQICYLKDSIKATYADNRQEVWRQNDLVRSEIKTAQEQLTGLISLHGANLSKSSESIAEQIERFQNVAHADVAAIQSTIAGVNSWPVLSPLNIQAWEAIKYAALKFDSDRQLRESGADRTKEVLIWANRFMQHQKWAIPQPGVLEVLLAVHDVIKPERVHV